VFKCIRLFALITEAGKLFLKIIQRIKSCFANPTDLYDDETPVRSVEYTAV